MHFSGCVSDSEEVSASHLLLLIITAVSSASLTQDIYERHIQHKVSLYIRNVLPIF